MTQFACIVTMFLSRIAADSLGEKSSLENQEANSPEKKSSCTKKAKSWAEKLVGLSKFDLPKNVLDIVYSQTICW